MKFLLFYAFIHISFAVNAKKNLQPIDSKPPIHLVPVTTRYFHTPESETVFEDPRMPEPMMVWNYFLGMVETPRPSGFPDVVVPVLLKYGQDLGLVSVRDNLDNVLIKKPASPGCENWPTVCLQTHWDIVTVKLDEIVLDFETDPLKPRIVDSPDERYGSIAIEATGTSLGADNGIGIALTFAILADNTLKHGPLEILVTRDEETSMIGAQDLPAGVLQSKYMINLDGDLGILVGCSGGFEETLRFPVTRTSVTGVGISIHIGGLKGGHSGGEIDQGRASALKLLAEAVDVTSRNTDLQDSLSLKSFVGGYKINAIPFEADTAFVVPAEKKDEFLANFELEAQKLKNEWKTIEPGLEFTVTSEAAAASHSAFDAASTQKTWNLIHMAPFGVLRFSPDIEGLVESSINLCIIRLGDSYDKDGNGNDLLHIEFFARSNDNNQVAFIHDRLVALARLGGGVESGPESAYPGWLPDLTSFLLLRAKEVYKDINRVDAQVYATHGSLEIGLFQANYPNLQAISIGPAMTDAHSYHEKLYPETIPDTYRFVVQLLAHLDE